MAGGIALATILHALGIGFLVAAGWGLLAGYWATHQPRYRLDLTPADFHLPHEVLALTASDGVQLAGWLVVPPSPRGIVIVQHGYGTCRADPLQLVALVARGGYAVVSMDFRGHGESGGRCTFGKRERFDVRAMLDYLGREPRLRGLPIGYLGISMGAAIGILTAAEDQRIRALVADSSYSRLGPMVSRFQWLSYRLPPIPFGWISAFCLSLELLTPLTRLDPVRAIGRMAPTPILIIHGTDDVSIPVRQARELYAAAKDPKALWIVPEAGHVAAVQCAEAEYEHRVLGFLNQYVGGPSR